MKTNKNMYLKKEFLNFFNAQEGYTLRSERFYSEFEAGALREKRIILWLEAAFLEGARVMAQDTLNTLGDYSVAVAYINEKHYTLSEAFDKAKDNLTVYFTQICDDKGESDE